MFSHGRVYSGEVMLSLVNDYRGCSQSRLSWSSVAYTHVKAEQATTSLRSWLTSLSEVNTFPALPESLTLALSTSSPLLSSKPSTAEDQYPARCLLQNGHGSHALIVLLFETKLCMCMSICGQCEGKVSRKGR